VDELSACQRKLTELGSLCEEVKSTGDEIAKRFGILKRSIEIRLIPAFESNKK